MELVSYQLRVNGAERQVEEAWLGESLLHVLRERLELAGAKNACEQGECGSCSVLMDGDLVCACLVLAASAVDADITTVEAMAANDPYSTGPLSIVQQAFVDAGAVQCGFCTPGLIMSVHDLLDRNPNPTDLETREAISGNLCRCTGYGRIFAAIEQAVSTRSAASLLGAAAERLNTGSTEKPSQNQVHEQPREQGQAPL
jgi:aerobic carbon-monoxide dehydrogenase small subunit